MHSSKDTSAGSAPIAYWLRAWSVILAALVAATGSTVAEVEQIANVRPGRLRDAIANPARLLLTDMMRLARMADLDMADLWEQVEEGARIVAAQVRDGAACHLCGCVFAAGRLRRPDGFGEHGQVFRCSDSRGCAVAEEDTAVRDALRCIYCGRDLTQVGANPLVVGHDDATGHVDHACGDGFGCNDPVTVKADR